MSKFIPASAAAVTVSLLLAACGGSTYSSGGSTAKTSAAAPAAPSGNATVKTVSNASFGGMILTDAKGMTLYRLSAETGGRFICTQPACLAVWHPLKASGAAPTGVPGLGTVKRPDGTEQVTYQGGPLYTFASDTAPGQTGGQGFRDVGTWSVVKVGGSSGGGSSAPASGGGEAGSSSEGTGYRY